MKTFFILNIVVCALALTLIPSCDDEPTAEEKFLEDISHSWTAEVITLDGMTLTGSFENFQITFKSDMTFTTQNGNDPIWPAAGSFTLESVSSTAGFNLVRSDGVAITVEELAGNVLVLSLQYTAPGGRTASVSGNYEFQFKR